MDQGVTISSNIVRDEDILKAKLGSDKAFNEQFSKYPEGLERIQAVHDAAAPIWKERNEPRLLTVDQEIAIPVGKVVHLLVTSNDVIHSWTIPSFGVKQQAVPGRTAAAWFQADKTGVYYGQCSVLCGKSHSAMPIVVRVVEQGVYDEWMAAVKAKDMKKAKSLLTAAASGTSSQSVAAAQ
jgi:cytochrome c oxidase subunit 2